MPARRLLPALPSGIMNQSTGEGTGNFSYYTRRIITSVALMRAAAVCPALSCISRAELAVIIDVICWPPIEIFTSAIRPLMRTDSMRPTS